MPQPTPDYFSQISYLMIEANSACNLQCITCNRQELAMQGLRPTKTLDPDEFSKMLSHFAECPIDTIKLEGLSEPMLHPRFAECASKIRHLFPNAHVIIATNLQYDLLRSAFLPTLTSVDLVYLSIDGIAEVYESSRIGAKWARLLRSLEQITAHVTPQQRKKLQINFTLTERNYLCLPDIYELKEKHQLGGVRINLAQNWNEHEKNKWNFHEDLLEFLIPYKADIKGVPAWDYHNCYWPYSGIVIDVYGDIRQCVINTSQDPIGNIFRDNIREIFNKSAHYQTTRQLLAQNQAPPECVNCDYKYLTSYLSKIFHKDIYATRPRPFKRFTEAQT